MVTDHVESWIGVDLDGTLAHYKGWQGELHIGEPIHAMTARVRLWLDRGQKVKIFTARVSGRVNKDGSDCQIDAIEKAIGDWCEQHIGQRLEVTCTKDYQMIELWDDRCVQVRPNTGERVGNE